MYSPQLGRFLSQDPLVAGQPDVLYDNDEFGDRLTMMRNLYGYADNNPVNWTDPSGFETVIDGAFGGILVCMAPGEKITAKACREACEKAFAKDRRFQEICKKSVCKVLKNATCTGLQSLCNHLLRHRQKRAAEACLEIKLILCPKKA